MFKKLIQTAVDRERNLSIKFVATSNRRSGESESFIGSYDDQKNGIKFYFDCMLYSRGPRMKNPSQFEGTIGYVFFDQILANYNRACQKKGITKELSDTNKISLASDLSLAFETIFSHMFENRPSLYKLYFIKSNGILYEDTYDVLNPKDGYPIQFNIIDVGPVRNLFEKDWIDLTKQEI